MVGGPRPEPRLRMKGCLNLRDQIGADRLLPLRVSSQPPGLIRWLLIAQCTICEALGMQLSLRDWGAPTEDGDVVEVEGYFGGRGARPPPSRGEPAPPPFAMQQQQAPPPMMAPPPYDVTDEGGMPSPRMQMRAPPPYGQDEPAVSPRGRAMPPPTPPGGFSAERSAHEEAIMGAHAAKRRNEGSFALGDGWQGSTPRQSTAADYGRAAPPSRGMDQSGGYAPRADERPSTGSSMASVEASRIRAKNQGSSIFG